MEKPTRRRSMTLIGIVTAFLLAVPTAVWASHQFTDVPDSHIFHTGISWMKDHNITVGCNPPSNTKFCPDDNVTRGQMATFMKRLAENRVVDAASVNGVTQNSFFHQAAPNTTDETIGTYGPITLYATCDGAGEPTLRASWNETVNHITLNGAGPSQFGNATVNAGTVISVGNGTFGSVGLADAVGYTTHFHTSVEFFLRDSPALGSNTCFFAGTVTVG
jgi:S-layer homology domain